MSDDDTLLPVVTFHSGVHEPHSFICGPDVHIVTLRARAPRAIAGALLEDIGDWMRALHGLKEADLPPAVVDQVTALHDATCNWVDWLDAGERSGRRAARAALDPERPGPGPA